MRRLTIKFAFAAAALAYLGSAGIASAQEMAANDHKSGYDFATADTQEMQDDDFTNPGFLWVDQGIEQWTKVEGEAGKSCQDCHGDVETMKGATNNYPKIDPDNAEKLINIELQINKCRTDQMKAKAWKWESDPILGMTALLTQQSRGTTVVSRADDPAYAAFMAKGKDFYYTRRGQLDLACKHCHEDNAGNTIRAETLSQGQSNGFPTYRLKWQKVGSLHRRFRGCNKNIRAAKLGNGSDEYLALELYLRERGAGLPIEGPSVRK